MSMRRLAIVPFLAQLYPENWETHRGPSEAQP